MNHSQFTYLLHVLPGADSPRMQNHEIEKEKFYPWEGVCPVIPANSPEDPPLENA